MNTRFMYKLVAMYWGLSGPREAIELYEQDVEMYYMLTLRSRRSGDTDEHGESGRMMLIVWKM
jgi:hypothetical protein